MSATENTPPGSAPATDERARVFHLLGSLYLEAPDERVLEEVSTWATRWLETDPDPPVADALAPIEAVGRGDAERLNEAFTRLFRGVVPDAPDPPYESLYRDGSLQGPSAQAVRTAYREAGLDLAPDSGELADHLGIELHFVGNLQEAGATEVADSFLTAHPCRWFDDFADTVRAADPAPFYRAVLDLTGIVLAAREVQDR